MAKQTGYAVIGLGAVARSSVLPAFARTAETSRLVAVVSGDRAKAQLIARQFHAAPYHYDELRQCLQREDVNAVYITLPNSLHCDYAVEAARTGVHVLCEAPMAPTADECRRMIRICQTNRVKLMIAYRVYVRPAVLKALALVRAGEIGAPRTFSSDNTCRIQDPSCTWLQRRLGGGTVYHLGVESIHAARSLLGSDPAQVMSMTARGERLYSGDVDESTVALIRFSDERLAHLHTSFAEEPTSEFTIFGEDGQLRVTSAYTANTPGRVTLIRGGERQEFPFDAIDEFATTLNGFTAALREDRVPEPSGVEGLQDIRIVEAIYRSSRDGRPVTLPRLARVDSPVVGESDAARPAVDRQVG